MVTKTPTGHVKSPKHKVKRTRKPKTFSIYKVTEIKWKDMTKEEIKKSLPYKKLLGRGKSSWSHEELVERLSNPMRLCESLSIAGGFQTIEYDNLPRSEKAGIHAKSPGGKKNFCMAMLTHKLKPRTKARNGWTRSPAKASKRAMVKHPEGSKKKKAVLKSSITKKSGSKIAA